MISNNQKKWIYKYKDGDYPIVNVFVKQGKSGLNLTNNAINKNELKCKGSFVYLFNETDTSWIPFLKKLGIEYACIWFENVYPRDTKFNDLLMDEISELNKFPSGWLCSGEFDFIEEIPTFKETLILLNLSEWIKKQPAPMFADTMFYLHCKLKRNIFGREFISGTPPGKSIPTPDIFYKKYYGSKWININMKSGINSPTYGISDKLKECIVTEN